MLDLIETFLWFVVIVNLIGAWRMGQNKKLGMSLWILSLTCFIIYTGIKQEFHQMILFFSYLLITLDMSIKSKTI